MAKLVFKNFFDERILSLVRPYYSRVLLAIGFSLLASGSSGAIAWLVKPVIDTIFVEKNYSMLTWLPVVIVLAYTMQGICKGVYNYLMYSAGFKMVRDLRVQLYDHLLRLPVLSVNRESSGKVISRILNDTTQIRSLVTDVILVFFREVPTIIVLLGVALYRRWDVTLLALIVLPALVGYAHKQGKRIKKKRKQAQEITASLSHFINEATTGSKVVKSFVNEIGLSDRFSKESRTHYRREVKILRHKEMAKLFANVCSGIGVALVIWYGGNLVVNEVITSGDLFSALGAVVMVFAPIKQLSKTYNKFQEVQAAVDRIKWIEEMNIEEGGDVALPCFEKQIRYENVSHRYGETGELVLEGIDVTINRGDVVAIVGPSGAGKTTFVDLLPRFYDPVQGSVLIDGHDITSVKLGDLRKLMGMVSQDVVLFNDTIKENICFGMWDATDEEIESAARLAHAHHFISEMEEGYDTMLGDRGINLSGGQRQRIAIARAFLKNPPILILDEATSALDSVSETLVQEALETLMSEKTTIVVAHRLSTIRNANRILVMEHGKIINQGTHEQLIKESPVYQELYQTFASGSSGNGDD